MHKAAWLPSFHKLNDGIGNELGRYDAVSGKAKWQYWRERGQDMLCNRFQNRRLATLTAQKAWADDVDPLEAKPGDRPFNSALGDLRSTFSPFFGRVVGLHAE